MKSLSELLVKFIMATKDKRMKWSGGQGGIFSCSLLEKYSVEIWEWDNRDEETSGISIQLKKGSLVMDRIIAPDFAKDYQILEELYAEARRSAYNIDEVIDEIDDFLSSDGEL